MKPDIITEIITESDKILLRTAAKTALSNAYAPYSKFHVGAAVLLTDGTLTTGCNVENASFGATNCAERTAIFTAVAQGKIGGQSTGKIKTIKIKAIAVITNSPTIATPCGICRQVIWEFGQDIPVLCISNAGENAEKEQIFTISQLLPFAFALK